QGLKYLSVKYISDPIIPLYKVSLIGLPARLRHKLFGGTIGGYLEESSIPISSTKAILTASVQKCLESTDPFSIVLAASMRVLFFLSATLFCSGNNTEVSGAINEPLVPDVTQPHIPNHASTSSHPAPQDRWSRDQHIKLVNIIGNPGEGMLTRSMAAKLTATSASECLFANFLFEIEHKKSAAMSSAEAEYVVDAGCYASILWMKSQLSDYDIYYKMTNNVVVVYQNFLKEFWSTVVAFDPFSSTDEPEKCPLKEFLIKFSVSNRQRPLTLDFQTFCSSTGLDYNNGKYVEHPTPKVVKKELGKIAINPSYLDKTLVLKNSFPVAWRILDSVSLPPLAAKPRKGKSQTVTSISPQS
nr:retrovirus-related Pol polyprotein from transposon TNT 1-94 [Tanacetum cinerariifolium]